MIYSLRNIWQHEILFAIHHTTVYPNALRPFTCPNPCIYFPNQITRPDISQPQSSQRIRKHPSSPLRSTPLFLLILHAQQLSVYMRGGQVTTTTSSSSCLRHRVHRSVQHSQLLYNITRPGGREKRKGQNARPKNKKRFKQSTPFTDKKETRRLVPNHAMHANDKDKGKKKKREEEERYCHTFQLCN